MPERFSKSNAVFNETVCQVQWLDRLFFILYNSDIMLEKKLVYTELYDEYHKLMTEKQCYVFELYYFDDFTLTEIAEKLSVSKQAINDTLKKACILLDDLENKLVLVKKNKLRNKIVESILQKNISENIKADLLKISQI